MEYPVSEGIEVSDAEADTLQHLCFVVTAFRKAVGVRDIEAVENIL